MRFSPDELRDKALYALEEVYRQCWDGAVEKTATLRFTLAYLAVVASDPEPFVGFWRVVTGGRDEEWGPQIARGRRMGEGRMHLLHIYRLLGLERPAGLP